MTTRGWEMLGPILLTSAVHILIAVFWAGSLEARQGETKDTLERHDAAITRNRDDIHQLSVSGKADAFNRSDWEIERQKLVTEFNEKVARIEATLSDVLKPIIESYARGRALEHP